MSVKYFHGFKGAWPVGFWNALGKDAQYVLADGFWSEDFPYPGSKELGRKYREKYGKHSVFIGLFYGVSQTLFMAIEKAGTLDGAKFREAVLTHEFKGTTMGDIKYRKDGTGSCPPAAFQWWDGKLMPVYPFTEGAWKVRLAPRGIKDSNN